MASLVVVPGPAARTWRDPSGDRRYDAQAIIDLARIVTVNRAGDPLARIPDVLNAEAAEANEYIVRTDADLRTRPFQLTQRRARLRHLDQPDQLCRSPEAIEFVDRLRALGLSERHEQAIRDGFVLSFALAPGLTLRPGLAHHPAERRRVRGRPPGIR